MVLLALVLASVSSAAPAPGASAAAAAPTSCDTAFRARFPALGKLFEDAAGFRAAAAASHASFTRVVKRGNALRKEAAGALEAIQGAGCELSASDTKGFDDCLAPIQWSCEGIPPGIDWSGLKDLPKESEEVLAFGLTSAGLDLLSGDVRFDGGCGDFGCAPKSVSLPGLLAHSKEVEQWITLASGKGGFAKRAVGAFERLGETWAQARCVGAESWRPTDAERKSVEAQLEGRRAGLKGKGTARLGHALGVLVSGLEKGVPAEVCASPGGE